QMRSNYSEVITRRKKVIIPGVCLSLGKMSKVQLTAYWEFPNYFIRCPPYKALWQAWSAFTD
ncbi:MAG: hypothetical protein D6772_16185, partial [Bacteroidetes bacterium]